MIRPWSERGTLAVACLVLLVGCKQARHHQEQPADASMAEAMADPASEAAETIAVDRASRIVSIGGDVTELLFALGAGDRIVAVDTTSIYPPEETEKLPKVGFMRKLAAEPILAHEPTVVIAGDGAGPPGVLDQLAEAGVTVWRVPPAEGVAAGKERIARMGQVLDETGRADELVKKLEDDLAAARQVAADAGEAPKVLFVYARGARVLQVAGTGTDAHRVIELAGANNAITEFAGFRPMTAEAVVAAAPDALLLLSHGVESLEGADAVWQLPGVNQTPAAKKQRLIVVDDLKLMGFGPRAGDAVLEVARALHAPHKDAD